jgi:hypothetical protein
VPDERAVDASAEVGVYLPPGVAGGVTPGLVTDDDGAWGDQVGLPKCVLDQRCRSSPRIADWRP